MNQDAALACLDKSKNKFKQGDKEGAIKFVKKSLQLYETKDALQWLSFIESNDPDPPSTTTPSKKLSEDPSESKSERAYTQEQVDGIAHIRRCKAKGDLYAVLGLEKECLEVDIKKAYRKLALRYHPDKCSAPGTDEAFKAIGHAFAVLSDENKRAHYDRFGVDSDAPRPSPGFQGFHQGPTSFEHELSPEEIFNMFFGGGGFQTHVQFGGGPRFRQFQTRQRTRQNQQQDDTLAWRFQLLQLLPILIMLFFSMTSLIFPEHRPYSMTHTPPYTEQRFTEWNNVPYYVQKNANEVWSQIDRHVEHEHVEQLKRKCLQEKEIQARRIAQARSWFYVDMDKLKQANDMKLTHCEKLRDFRFG